MLAISTVAAPSPFNRDPRAMLAWEAGGQSLYAGTSDDMVSAFWTAVDNMGDYQTSSPASATRTIVNVTGRGWLRGAIGPQVGASPTTWTITIDGRAYTLTAGTTANYRSILGAIATGRTVYTTANHSGGIAASNDLASRADTTSAARIGTDVQLLAAPLITGGVKFDASLKVEVACASLGSGALPGYCGAIWSLDP
jgi:hypothetical protein